MQSTEGLRLYALDHLRALAAILVFYWHGLRMLGIKATYQPIDWVTSLFEEGWIGVSLFMVITGFTFTILTHGRKIDYLPFLQNRFLRIFPLLFLVMLYGAALGKVPKDSVMQFFNLLGGGLVFGTWSLVVEFQFYLAYPFLRNKLVSAKGPDVIWSKTLIACASLCGLFLAFRLAFYFEKSQVQMLSYWSIFGHADEFLAGIIGGLLFLRFRGSRSPWLPVVLSAFVIVTLYVNFRLNWAGGFYNFPTYPSPSPLWIVWPTISAILWGGIVCIYCIYATRWTSYSARVIGYIGEISFSLYMLHFITIPMSTRIFAILWGTTRPISDQYVNALTLLTVWHLPITIAVCAASYHFIEQPFLANRKPYLGPRPDFKGSDLRQPTAVA